MLPQQLSHGLAEAQLVHGMRNTMGQQHLLLYRAPWKSAYAC